MAIGIYYKLPVKMVCHNHNVYIFVNIKETPLL
jgi:hypothetical protein